MERRCRDAGFVFQPLIFESLGGVSSETEKVLKSLNQAVAANTDSPLREVAPQFWHRVSIDIVRGCHRAFAKRTMDKSGEIVGGGPFGGSWGNAGLAIPDGI